ncbi:MAG: hypothetical protein IID43_06895 [Planctomycetes bacterium]|nr:hypothetical protein [Planctomycetota bacterium]
MASFFVSRVDSLVDKELEQKRSAGGDVDRLLGRAALANAKLAYARFEEVFGDSGQFAKLSAKGARVQRPLWASTSTKNPAYPDTYYVDLLIGAETVNTMPLGTIEAFKDHGTAAATIEKDVSAYREATERIEAAGISMKTVTAELLEAGVKAFADSFDALMTDIRAKVTQLQTA